MIIFNSEELKAASFNDDWHKVKKEFYTLRNLIDEIQKARDIRQSVERQVAHLKAMKAVKYLGSVYFLHNGDPEIPYGTELMKCKDNKKYMSCTAPNGKKWKIPYSWLSIEKPDESQISTNRRLSKLLTGI